MYYLVLANYVKKGAFTGIIFRDDCIVGIPLLVRVVQEKLKKKKKTKFAHFEARSANFTI